MHPQRQHGNGKGMSQRFTSLISQICSRSEGAKQKGKGVLTALQTIFKKGQFMWNTSTRQHKHKSHTTGAKTKNICTTLPHTMLKNKAGDLSYMSSCGPSSCSSSCQSSCGGWWAQSEGWGRAVCCYLGCWSLRWLWKKGRSHHSPELKGDIALQVSKGW